MLYLPSFTLVDGIGRDKSKVDIQDRIEKNITRLKHYEGSPDLIQFYYFIKNRVLQSINIDGRDSGLAELTGGSRDHYLLDLIFCTLRDICAILKSVSKGDTKSTVIVTDARVVSAIIEFLQILKSHNIDRDEWFEYVSNSGLSNSAKIEYLRNILESLRATEFDRTQTRYSLSQIQQ